MRKKSRKISVLFFALCLYLTNITSFAFQLEKQLKTKLRQQNQENTFISSNLLKNFLQETALIF